MSTPTARELLDADAQGLSVPTGDPYVRDYSPLKTLSARVEKVLELPDVDYAADSQAAGYNAALAQVRRLLNGEEP